IPVIDVTKETGVISPTDLPILVLSNPGVLLRATPIQFALLVDVDTKESVVELQADKKPGALGRVFAITEGQAANTSEHHATIDCHSYRIIFGDIHAPEYTYHGSLPGKPMQIISALQARTLLYHGCEGFLATIHDMTSGQADKKPGALGRVFSITEGQIANTSEHHATIDCHSYRVIFGDIHAPEYTY
nr:reverse transcriptase domain-containing protein [Tanacetum cinerariifolium]